MKKLRVYLTHDTEDVELVNLLVDALNSMGIFDVSLSPFDLPGTVPKLDYAKKAEIERCDFLVALFTRRSMRLTLVKEEINLARLRNKVVVPLLEQHAKIPKIGKIVGEYQETKFSRMNPVIALNRILTIVDIAQTKLGISRDSITQARRALKEYSKQQFILKISKATRIATFRRIVAEALKKVGYSVREQSHFVSVPHKTSDITATKEGRRINVACFFRTINVRDVVRTAKYAKSEVGESWIVTTGFTPEAQSMASAKGINLVLIQWLLEELIPSAKEPLWQRFVQLVNTEATSIVNRKFYPELRALMRAVYSAKTSVEKGRSLERLAECFVNLFSGLEVVGKNIRIEAEELDLVVKNEVEKIFWQRLGAPIIVECKNWTKPVGAREIRDLVQKMREVRTAFLIAAHGVTSRDGAYYEIIEARKNMKFILVFDTRDIEEILRGTNPEEIVQEKFYSLWTKA